MKKHKCGTCRFFQEAGLAGSGWCHHPQRKTTSDLMIMVRKNELACRDEWSHDLWEVATGDAGAGDESSRGVAEPFPARRMDPASADEIAALIQTELAAGAADREVSPPVQEDVVLSELGVVVDQKRERGSPPPAPPEIFPLREADTRTAIIKARETYRERMRQQTGRLAEPPARSEAVSTPEPSGQHVAANGWRQRPSETQAAAGSLDGSSVDEFRANAGPVAATDRTWPVGALEPTGAPDEPADNERPARVAVPAAATERERASRPGLPSIEAGGRGDRGDDDRTDSASSSYWSRGARPQQASARPRSTAPRSLRAMLFGVPRSATAADLTESEAWSASDQQWDDPDPDDRFDLDLEELGGVDSRSLADPAPVDDADAYADHSVLDSLVAEPATAAERREQVRDDIVIEPEPIELAVRLAPELPRICRTCRDFRPAEVGDRGWCANPWAFTHRRMVDPNEPAPCEGTLGSWWLPVDEVWLTGADVSSHGQPTPLLDAMLPHHRDQVIRRRRS